MNRFEFARAASLAEARDLVAEKPGSLLKAGGIDLLDHLKEHLLEPPRLVDLKGIPDLNAIRIEADGSLRIGPLVPLAQVAAHTGIRGTHAALAQAGERPVVEAEWEVREDSARGRPESSDLPVEP